MSDYKFLYVFKDPFGSDNTKPGITQNMANRLGVYQNSYSRESHVACFDTVYYGPASAVNQLERVIKRDLHWNIQRDGRGHSEWVNLPFATLVNLIDEIIDGYKFKVTKVSKEYLPITVDNVDEFLDSLSD